MKYILLHIFTLFYFALIGQNSDNKRDYTWVWGYGYNEVLNFNFNPPSQSVTISVLSMLDMSASISDTSGNLLFYTNGYKIINKNHVLMENGDSITCCLGVFQQGMQNGFGASQSALILPKPASSNLYYVFNEPLDIWATAPYFQYTPVVFYSIVDMSYNGGLGKVIQKNIPLLSDTLNIGFLTACRHANGRDWWMLIREYESNRYHRFLISPNGVEEVGIQIVGNAIPQYSFGQTIFSPDGNKFVVTQKDQYIGQYIHLFTYDFDRCTGLLSNFQADTIVNPSSLAGCAFSPTSRYLYLSSQDSLFQFDMQNPNWQSTKQTCAYWTTWLDSAGNGYGFGFMALAPNGKIYMSCTSSPYLNVIPSPDSVGTACNFIHHGFPLSTNNGRCMPNFPHFRLGPLIGSACDTLQSVGISLPISAQSAVKVYPNPANETLHLHSENLQGNASVSLRNLVGQELKNDIWQNTAIEKELNLSHLPQGVYYLRILAGEKRFTYKIMKE